MSIISQVPTLLLMLICIYVVLNALSERVFLKEGGGPGGGGGCCC